MADDTKDHQKNDDLTGSLARREFVGLSLAAGLAATAGSASAALDVVETNVDIKTPDGTCDAAFFHPKSGTYAGVLIWPDAFGLRPSLRGIGRRLAAEGYSVLVPNPFYRVAKDPFTDASTVNFQRDRAKITPLMTSVTTAGNAEKDAIAYIAFLDAQKEVDKKKKIGTQGYCMGGPLVLRTAATISGSHRSGRLVPRRRPCYPRPQQPAFARSKDQGEIVFRHRVERRQATAGREGQTEGSFPRREDRSVWRCHARLVHPGYAAAGKRYADL